VAERRTPIALLEDRGRRADKALAALGDTDPGDTPPATLKALCAALRERLDAAEARLLRPAGQLSMREIMERAAKRGGEGGEG
jgi:hypothetical protein